MEAGILGIEYHVPDRIETNAELAEENPTWPLDRIEKKCGISARRIAAEDETAGDLGYVAARKLLDRKIIPDEEIDFLLLCTQSPDHFLPTTACLLQNRLGLGQHIGAIDFNLGCSGFVYGLFLAKQMVVSGAARNVLLITAETYTKYIHPNDRVVRPLFGDGAAATLIGRDAPHGTIGQFVLGTDGQGGEKLIVPAGGARMPRTEETGIEEVDLGGSIRSKDHLYMSGMALMNFGVNVVPEAVRQMMRNESLGMDDIDWFVFHQANRFMLEHLTNACHVPWEKTALFYEEIGNTVSPTIPIVMAEYVKDGKITSGQKLLLAGFGVGYSWATCMVDW
ncbi:MAG: ketoacyl-ACP synthase III [Planctomycetia bacterium]|jgi:3-oxoacyl-[acyl-carrier-protein] synthase-3